jgi:hypothetical protein
MEDIPPGVASSIVAIALGMICLIAVLIVVASVARYVAEAALIRMVGDHEETGQRHSVWEGFRLGWSRAAFRLFLIDLLTTLPVVLALIVILLIAASPLLMWTTRSTTARVIGTAASVSLILLVMLLAIVVGVGLSILTRLFRRVCVLERQGVTESIRKGYALARQHIGAVLLMWLITLGLGIVFVVLMIPDVLLLVLLGALLGGVPALAVGALATPVFGVAAPWILAAVIGLPIFVLVVAVPLTLLNGLWEAFKSSVWTLAYRRLLAL